MAFKKITDADVKGKGNVGRPDTPGVSTAEMQRIMDEIPREVIIPAFNALIDALADKTSAATLGITAPEGIAGSTVQEVVNALLAYVNAHKNDQANPHAVTAAQVDAYTKKQTDDAINEKLTEIGSGDMAQAVYDPTGQRKDVFLAINTAITEALVATMLRATYDPQGRQSDIFKAVDSVAPRYKARYTLAGWAAVTDETAKANGYAYTQTATLTPLDANAPEITADSDFLSPPRYEPPGVPATEEVLDAVLAIIDAGHTVSGTNAVTTMVQELPDAEIEIIWKMRP